MAALSDSELLTATREAIDSLTTGRFQSVTINQRTFTRLQLDELWKQVGILERRIARSDKGISSVSKFTGVS